MEAERVNGPLAEPHNLFLRLRIRFFPFTKEKGNLVSIVTSERLIAKEENLDGSSSCRPPDSPRFRYSFEINYAGERLFGARGDNDTIERNFTAAEG